VQLHIAGWSVLVVGGGTVAARKVRRLLECGAQVSVIAPELVAELESLAADGTIVRRRRTFSPVDVRGSRLVFAATDDRAVNAAVVAAAEAAGIPVNAVDDPDESTFTLPARIRRGDLQVSIATEGGAPFLARRLRERWEQRLGPAWEPWLQAAARFRREVQARIVDPAARQRLYDRFVEHTLGPSGGSAGAGDEVPAEASEPGLWNAWIAGESAAQEPASRNDGDRP
jgi:siroheme synthase-like protein